MPTHVVQEGGDMVFIDSGEICCGQICSKLLQNRPVIFLYDITSFLIFPTFSL
jgi:hypothetical protein